MYQNKHLLYLSVNLMDAASLLSTSPRRISDKKRHGKKRPTTASQKKSFPSFHSKSASASSFKASVQQGKASHKSRSQDRASLKKVESASNLFESLGIHMVDELPAAVSGRDSDDSDSEIKTEAEDDRIKAHTMNNHSDSEIITEIGSTNLKPVAPFRAVVAQSVR